MGVKAGAMRSKNPKAKGMRTRGVRYAETLPRFSNWNTVCINLDHQLHFPDEETRARVQRDLPSW